MLTLPQVPGLTGKACLLLNLEPSIRHLIPRQVTGEPAPARTQPVGADPQRQRQDTVLHRPLTVRPHQPGGWQAPVAGRLSGLDQPRARRPLEDASEKGAGTLGAVSFAIRIADAIFMT